MTTERDGADVIVVGAGNAALTAAIAARQAGADVLVLESAPEALRGGNTRFTGGIFRFAYPSLDALTPLLDGDDLSDVIVDPYSAEQYLDDLERLSEGLHDAALSRVLIDRSLDTVQWLTSLGVRWEFARTAVEARSADGSRIGLQLGAAVRTAGKGPALSDTLFARAQELGVRVRYETTADDFAVDDAGAIAGVIVTSGDERLTLPCRAVVLGCGGFESSAQERGDHLGDGWDQVKVRGTRFNTGRMLFAALRHGADRAGDWSESHATPLAADSPDYGDLELGAATNRLSYPYGVMVNLRGERFADEGEDFKLYTYAKMGTAIANQPHRLAIQIFDQRVLPLLEERYEHSEPIAAGDLGALCAALEDRFGDRGLRASAVRATVEAYNDACGTGEFDPIVLDGLRTSGLEIDKTNWARPIEEAPLLAYPVTAGITFTFGGLRIAPDSSVLRTDGSPLPGLYATGEITGGFFYRNYPAGAGLMRGAVFGRLAGEQAANLAGDR